MRRHIKICSSTSATPEKYGLRSSGKRSTLVQDDAVHPHRLAPSGVVRRDRRPPDANGCRRANADEGPVDRDSAHSPDAGCRVGRDTHRAAGESAPAPARWSRPPRRSRLLRGRAHRLPLPEHSSTTIRLVAAELDSSRGPLRHAGERLAVAPAGLFPGPDPRRVAESLAARNDVASLRYELR